MRARSSIESVEVTHQQTLDLNAESKEVQADMRQTISEARHINDEFLQGLESLSKKTASTDAHSQTLLAETAQIQQEMHSILDLKQGIESFQQAVDTGQAQLEGLIARVDQYQEQSASHEMMVGQYKQRMETYQADVTRYRESMLQLEKRFRSDEQFHSQELETEDDISSVTLLQAKRLVIQALAGCKQKYPASIRRWIELQTRIAGRLRAGD